MYIVHQNYEPRKLTRYGHDNWNLGTYTRTSDPFPGVANVTGVTKDNWTLVDFSGGHSFTVGMTITFASVGGMTQLNGNTYLVGSVTSSTRIRINNLSGSWLDSTAFTNYTTGGTASTNSYPGAVAFTEDSRTVFGGSLAAPERLNYSRAPSSAGALRYDDSTTGSSPSDALQSTLSPLRGKVDSIR